MNRDGHPVTLRAAQPGNRNALKSGLHSPRARAERVEAIRAAASGISTVALARAALCEEVALLRRVREALDEDIVMRGVSTRAGAARGQVSQRFRVSGQLEKLEMTWAMGQLLEGDDVVDRLSDDGAVDALREELLRSLTLRDLLDHDLEHRGVSTPRGGRERRQVGQRLQASRDLVRLGDRIRTEARRAARSGAAPMSTWDVAREIGLDPSQPPSDAIAAGEFLLTHRTPRVISPELEGWEEEVRAMSEEEIDAALRELEADDSEPRATPGRDANVAADTEDEPEASEAPGTDVIARCLAILQRIGDGVDLRASGRDRMRAARLREQYLAVRPRSAFLDEIESMTLEELREFCADLDDEHTGVEGSAQRA